MLDRSFSPWVRLTLSCALVGLVGTGCATNPATGKSQLSLIGEQQEIQMGREADQQVTAQMGLYDDPELQAYIQALGESLAAKSERPQLPWTFRVVDDPVVNAFALPGGFIYITRGIMAHMNSEAELASVLGHEIGHVTARHSVNQLSKAQLASLGMTLGMILEPALQRYSDVAQMGMQMMFLKFSRDDERQADDLGLRYSVRADYDPRQMPEMFTVLQRVGEQAGGGRIPGWASTHPAPENRRSRIEGELAELNLDFDSMKLGRDSYYQRLDGMVFGENPREGFFEESSFYHPDMEFRLDLPDGWQNRNTRQAVVAVSPDEDAVLVLTLAEDAEPREAARAFLGQEGIQAGQIRTGKVNGLPAAWGIFEAQTEQFQLAGRVVYVRHREATFELLGYTLVDRWRRYSGAFDRSQGSFARLTDPRALSVEPAHLETVKLRQGMSLQEFGTRYPSSVPLEDVGLINHLRPDGVFGPDSLAKRVIGGTN